MDAFVFLSEPTTTELCVGAQEVLLEKSYEVKLSKTGATTDFTGPSPNLRKSPFLQKREKGKWKS